MPFRSTEFRLTDYSHYCFYIRLFGTEKSSLGRQETPILPRIISLKKIFFTIGLHFLVIGHLYAATYYVSPAGNDSNSGVTPNTPWQTIAKVNGATYNSGDSVLFQGGQTFTGNLQFTVRATSVEPFTIGSYETGHAVVNAGAGTGLSAYNCSGFVV